MVLSDYIWGKVTKPGIRCVCWKSGHNLVRFCRPCAQSLWRTWCIFIFFTISLFISQSLFGALRLTKQFLSHIGTFTILISPRSFVNLVVFLWDICNIVFFVSYLFLDLDNLNLQSFQKRKSIHIMSTLKFWVSKGLSKKIIKNLFLKKAIAFFRYVMHDFNGSYKCHKFPVKPHSFSLIIFLIFIKTLFCFLTLMLRAGNS